MNKTKENLPPDPEGFLYFLSSEKDFVCSDLQKTPLKIT